MKTTGNLMKKSKLIVASFLLLILLFSITFGAAVFGEQEGSLYYEESGELYLRGEKVWVGDDNNSGNTRPANLDIYLYRNNTLIDTYTTNAAKDWKYEFDLSEYPLDSTFTIDEEVVPFYSKSITQPVITTVSAAMGAWTKYSPNNNLLFPIDINQIVVVKKGNEDLIWSQTGLDDSEKAIIIESLNENAPGYGNPKTIKFISGFGKVSGTNTDFDDNVTFHADSNIEFEKTNFWSLIFQGNFIHEHRQIDDSEIINSFIGVPPGETEPSETKPSETEPSETKPSETEPSETKPSETEPSETEPSETEPSETKPSETEPSETEPSETEPSETPTTATETPATEEPIATTTTTTELTTTELTTTELTTTEETEETKPTVLPIKPETTTPATKELPATGENHNNYGIYFLGMGLTLLVAAGIGVFTKRKFKE